MKKEDTTIIYPTERTPDDIVIEPRESNIYLVLDEVPDKAGSIYLSQTQATPSRIGTVIAVGVECKYYKAGDRVLLTPFPGDNLYLWQYGITDERYRIVSEHNILGKVIKE
jgi:co-chaperonin GroES (HSP10)